MSTRDVKVLVLDRVIKCVALTLDKPAVANALNILKGADALNTNLFFQDLARAGMSSPFPSVIVEFNNQVARYAVQCLQ